MTEETTTTPQPIAEPSAEDNFDAFMESGGDGVGTELPVEEQQAPPGQDAETPDPEPDPLEVEKEPPTEEGAEEPEEKVPTEDAPPVDPPAKPFGEFDTLDELLEDHQHKSTLIGRQGEELGSLREAQKASEIESIEALAKTDPTLAQERLDKLTQEEADGVVDELAEFSAVGPKAFFQKNLTETVRTVLEDMQKGRIYADTLRKTYPSYDGLEGSRGEIQAAIDNGTIGRDELLQLAALGRGVRDGSLRIKSSGTPSTTDEGIPAATGTRTPARSPETAGRKPQVKSPEEELDADIMAMGDLQSEPNML